MGGEPTQPRNAGPARPIRVLIIEREPLVRHRLAQRLAADAALAVAGMTASAWEGARLADDLRPDVLLVGTTLPDAPGFAAAAGLGRRFPAIATIVVTAHESDDELFAAAYAGALACCGQDLDEPALLALIKRVAAGEHVISAQVLATPHVAARVLRHFRAAGELAAPTAFAPLTERETEILDGVSNGRPAADLARALGISVQTIKNHLTSILRKLAANARGGL